MASNERSSGMTVFELISVVVATVSALVAAGCAWMALRELDILTVTLEEMKKGNSQTRELSLTGLRLAESSNALTQESNQLTQRSIEVSEAANRESLRLTKKSIEATEAANREGLRLTREAYLLAKETSATNERQVDQGLWLTRQSINIADKGLQVTQRSVDLMEQDIATGRDALALTRESLELTQRPWLVVDRVTFVIEPNRQAMVTVKLHNVGLGPIVRLGYKSYLTEGEEPPSNEPIDYEYSTTIGSSQSFPFNVYFPWEFSKEGIRQLRRGEALLRFHCRFRYEDQFGKEHSLNVCQEFDSELGLAVECSRKQGVMGSIGAGASNPVMQRTPELALRRR